jgi:uncharacterized protein
MASNFVNDISELKGLYGDPAPASIGKVVSELTPLYTKWIMASRFCIVSTVGSDGTDGSPRGDDGPVVRPLDMHTLAMPDWRGNNRMDTLRNIVEDGRISLMFMVPGSNTVVRLNGSAKLSINPELTRQFEIKGRHPCSVILITIAEIYTQCARAPMRAGLWSGEPAPHDLPTVGELLAEATSGEQGGKSYDDDWLPRALETMW